MPLPLTSIMDEPILECDKFTAYEIKKSELTPTNDQE